MKILPKSKRLIAWPEMERRVPYTRQHLMRLEKAGMFPQRVQVGGRRVAWIESEVDEWIDDRAAERGQAA